LRISINSRRKSKIKVVMNQMRRNSIDFLMVEITIIKIRRDRSKEFSMLLSPEEAKEGIQVQLEVLNNREEENTIKARESIRVITRDQERHKEASTSKETRK
jgi:hypothetical protein